MSRIGQLQYRSLVSLMRRLARVREERATVDGRHVPFFARRGKRAAVLFIHGFGADKEGWLLLASLVGRRRALAIPDLPGFGAADPIPPELAGPTHQADALACVLDAAGVERAHIVGNSMGGGIAMAFAAAYPRRVHTLTLVASVGPEVEKSEAGRAFERGENPLIVRDATEMESFLRLVAEKRVPATRAMLAYLAADRVARAEAHREIFDAWIRATEGATVPPIAVPTLVLHGTHDRIIHPSTARALAAAIPGSRLEMLDGIGHAPQIEAPWPLARRLESFWGTL